MADFTDLAPLFQETIDTIRTRLDADTNAGLAPGEPGYLDPTPGGFYWDLTQAPALEIDRMWDALSELLAAAFPATAWDQYLDYHGVTVDTPRKDASRATGYVRFSGDDGSFVAVGTVIAVAQIDPDADEVTFEAVESGTISSGTLDLAVQAVEAGSAGNVETDTVTVLVSPVGGISSVTNPAPITGGAEIETDEAYRVRVLLAYAGVHGGGTVDDYLSWALAYPGVGHATVEPVWSGPGTVRVVITDPDNNPVSAGVVAGLQDQLDPVAGQGRGLAPIGATVTVATPTSKAITVVADVSLSTGYSLDGAGGTENLTDPITTAIRGYVNGLAPGDDVVLKHVIAAIFQVVGVYDVPTITLNGSAANVAVGALEVALLVEPVSLS